MSRGSPLVTTALVARDNGRAGRVVHARLVAITAASANSVCARFDETVQRVGARTALRSPDGSEYSWREYYDRVRDVSAGLAGLGLARGDVIAFWSSNRPEVHIAEVAAMHIGVASCSIYTALTIEHATSVVADAGARVLVTEPAYVDRAIAVREGGATAVDHIVCLEGDAPEALGWDELLDAARSDFDFETAWRAVRPEDLAAVVYTSGIAGPPKGVELAHASICRQAAALAERLSFPETTGTVSFLPSADIASRLFTHYLPIFLGAEVTCCSDPRQATEVIAAARPGYLFGPPRLWDRLRTLVLSWAEKTSRTAIAASIERVRAGGGPQDGPVQGAARAKVGLDGISVAVVGSTHCPRDVIEFWHGCGVPLSELYGTSEMAGAIAVASPAEARIGTAGPPLPGCEVRPSASGEIWVRGPALMRGYRGHRSGSGSGVGDDDGWCPSGDLGALDPNGHLLIAGRIDEQIVSAAGNQMSPVKIEATLRSGASLLGPTCVIGDGHTYNVALVTLDPDAARAWSARYRVPAEHLRFHRLVVETVRAEVLEGNVKLDPPERVARFALLGEEWSPDGDELTATMKLRRDQIARKYASTIDGLYDGTVGFDANV